jgi:Transposase
MDYFAGLDVSVKETSVCIVDDAGKIVREARVASEPEALLQVLTNTLYHFKRIGLEAGPLSQWLYSVLAEAGLPVICVETRHMRAVLKAQMNKTDRNDARGMAQTMRAGLYRPVHVKTLRSQKLRVLLTHRKLQSKAVAIRTTCAPPCATSVSRWGLWGRLSSRRALGSSSRTSAIWLCCRANRLPSCIAACWPSFGTMTCAGV